MLWLRRIGAVLAGVFVTAALSIATDGLMRALGLFPAPEQVMSQSQFAAAAVYRALFTVAGGYATARLAPDARQAHVWVLAGLGLLAGLGGLAGWFAAGGAKLGPLWYAAFLFPVTGLPCVPLGGLLGGAARLARPLAGRAAG